MDVTEKERLEFGEQTALEDTLAKTWEEETDLDWTVIGHTDNR